MKQILQFMFFFSLFLILTCTFVAIFLGYISKMLFVCLCSFFFDSILVRLLFLALYVTLFLPYLRILWHFLLACEFCYLAFEWKYKLMFANKQAFLYSKFASLLLGVIAVLIPLCWNNITNIYGKQYELEGKYDPVCWTCPTIQTCFFALISFLIIVYLIVLVAALIKHLQTRRFTVAYWYFVIRLLPWILIYVIVAMIPCLIEIWRLAMTESTQNNVGMLVIIQVDLSCIGIANALAWYVPYKLYIIHT